MSLARLTSRISVFLAAAAFSCAAIAPASAQSRAASDDEAISFPHLFAGNPIFRDGLTGFQTLDGRGFSLERHGNTTLFKMDDQNEVWALESVPGPRGDEFLKNDQGRLFVRLTDLGGVIVYLPSHPNGIPVDPVATPQPIAQPTLLPDMAHSLTLYLTLRIGHPITVAIDDIEDQRERWLQDAARVAGEALVGMPDEARQVHSLAVQAGDYADLNFSDDGILTIYVNPEQEYRGRPSSDSLAFYLRQRIAS